MTARILLATVVLTVALAGPASAASLRAQPRYADFNEQVTIRGTDWPVIEFCSRTVKLTLESDQNTYTIGFVGVRDDGSFRRRWTPRRSQVGAGAWRMVARLRCESGDDGSPVVLRRRYAVRIG